MIERDSKTTRIPSPNEKLIEDVIKPQNAQFACCQAHPCLLIQPANLTGAIFFKETVSKVSVARSEVHPNAGQELCQNLTSL